MQESSIPGSGAPPCPPKPVRVPAAAGPSPEQRQAAISSLQSQALAKTDLLAANLGLINGDLMYWAHQIREATETVLTASPPSLEAAEALRRHADLYLRFVRQIERFARIERQQSNAVPGP